MVILIALVLLVLAMKLSSRLGGPLVHFFKHVVLFCAAAAVLVFGVAAVASSPVGALVGALAIAAILVAGRFEFQRQLAAFERHAKPAKTSPKIRVER